MNRREFVVGSAAALVVAAAGGSYVFSSCPLDTDKTGVCTGPCLAFIDWDDDGHCDRIPAPVLAHAVTETAGSQQTTKIERVCPFGLISDPYPGQCHLYVDENGDGLCDLSQGEITTNAKDDQMPVPDQAAPDQPLTGAGPVLTACPLGLINDPHPGECQRYIDENGNGLCDLSEPALIASGAVPPLPTPVRPEPQPEGTLPRRPVTACPYGLVNDPYPGECRKYIDENGNGLCDLSEPDLVTMETLVLPSQVVGSGHQGQQRRRGQ